MDNLNQPPGQDSQQHQPTQPFRFTPGWPGGAAQGQGPAGPGHGPAGQPGQPQPGQPQPGSPYGPSQPGGQYQPGNPYLQPGSPYAQPGQSQPGGPYSPQPGQPERKSKKLRWGAGVAAVALLAAGGTVAGLKLAGHSSPAATSNAAQATALNSELSSGGSSACQTTSGSGTSSSSSTSGTSSSTSGKTRCHRRHLHLLRLIHGMYGEVAFHTSSGTQTLAFERGVIESVGDGHVVIRARNGTTWTWSLVSNSVVRKDGQAAASSAIAKGELAFAGGQATGSTKDIRLIILRPASSQGSSSSSQSSSSSSSA